MIHLVIWQPPSVTDVADDGARLPESRLDSESSDAMDDIVELEVYGGRITREGCGTRHDLNEDTNECHGPNIRRCHECVAECRWKLYLEGLNSDSVHSILGNGGNLR
jgi:hypothetical protein